MKKGRKSTPLLELIGEAFAEALIKARKIASFINKSSQAKEKLLKIQIFFDPNKVAETVITDVVTRWWSTLDMIERLLHLRKAINCLDGRKSLH